MLFFESEQTSVISSFDISFGNHLFKVSIDLQYLFNAHSIESIAYYSMGTLILVFATQTFSLTM